MGSLRVEVSCKEPCLKCTLEKVAASQDILGPCHQPNRFFACYVPLPCSPTVSLLDLTYLFV